MPDIQRLSGNTTSGIDKSDGSIISMLLNSKEKTIVMISTMSGQTAIDLYTSHENGFKFTILGPECTKYQNKLLRIFANGTIVQRRSFAAASPAG